MCLMRTILLFCLLVYLLALPALAADATIVGKFKTATRHALKTIGETVAACLRMVPQA